MVLANYIRSVPGVTLRMHFTDDYWIDRSIQDKESGKLKRIRSLVFWVDELNGQDCARTYSVMSEKLAAALTPYLPDKGYLPYDFLVTQLGDGFYKDWNVQVIKRPQTE